MVHLHLYVLLAVLLTFLALARYHGFLFHSAPLRSAALFVTSIQQDADLSIIQDIGVSPGYINSKATRYFGDTNIKARSSWNQSVLNLDRNCPIILSGKHQRSGLGHAFMSFNVLVAMTSFYGITLNASFPERLSHSVDRDKVARFFPGDVFRSRFTEWICHERLEVDSRGLPAAIEIARRSCENGPVCLILTQEVPAAEVLIDVPSYRRNFEVPLDYLEDLKHVSGFNNDYFRVAVHIRRGDIVGRSRWAGRWVSNEAYVDFIPKLISRIQVKRPISVLLFVEGALSVDRIPDVDGTSHTNFSVIHEHVVLAPHEMHLALAAMCASDMLVTTLSGFSHFVALMCDKPHVLALPFWHDYVEIPNLLTELRYAQDANKTITRIELPASFQHPK